MLNADTLVSSAKERTGLEDFGGIDFREGLERLVDALVGEAALTQLGEEILSSRISSLLENRLRVEAVFGAHPEITEELPEGPLFIVGLPRTGTTALSQLIAADPQVRSLRLWESTQPVPPPEKATEDRDPRIAETEAGLRMMYEVFPRMLTLYFQTATGPTECQDLLGMSFRTAHFDGMAHVPSYTQWVLDCDMKPAYRYHQRMLQLLQWKCGPRLWHLKTPVHMLSLDALLSAYPGALFIWAHRDPAAVLGSVCSLVSYTRSWVSDRDDSVEIGNQQADLWELALHRAITVRDRIGDHRFADVYFDDLQRDPLVAVARAYTHLGIDFGDPATAAVGAWARAHPPGSHGTHEFDLHDFGLDTAQARQRFSFYLDRFGVPVDGP